MKALCLVIPMSMCCVALFSQEHPREQGRPERGGPDAREQLTWLRDQAPTRANARKLEWDSKFGLVKLNPLADWTSSQVWDYIRAHGVSYNPLHDRNYPSIGCTHCTRPVLPGEDPRAGRWSGFQKTECGLHAK